MQNEVGNEVETEVEVKKLLSLEIMEAKFKNAEKAHSNSFAILKSTKVPGGESVTGIFTGMTKPTLSKSGNGKYTPFTIDMIVLSEGIALEYIKPVPVVIQIPTPPEIPDAQQLEHEEIETIMPETDYKYRLQQMVMYRFKVYEIAPDVVNSLKPLDIIQVKGTRLNIFTPSGSTTPALSINAQVIIQLPTLTVHGELTKLGLEKNFFTKEPFVSTHARDSSAILGTTEGNSTYDPKKYHIYRCNQKSNNAKAIFNLGMQKYMMGWMTTTPNQPNCFFRIDKNNVELMAFKTPEKMMDMGLTIVQGTESEIEMVEAWVPIWMDGLANLYVEDITHWKELAPVFAPGLVFDCIHCVDDDSSAAIATYTNDDPFDIKVKLKGSVFVDLAETLKNVGIPLSFAAAKLIHGKMSTDADTKIVNLMRVTPNKKLTVPGNERAINLNNVDGELTRLVKATETGEVQLYLITNSNVEKGEGDDDVEYAKKVKSITKTATNYIYAVSNNRPFKELIGSFPEDDERETKKMKLDN